MHFRSLTGLNKLNLKSIGKTKKKNPPMGRILAHRPPWLAGETDFFLHHTHGPG
jgi:hypothetical protein